MANLRERQFLQKLLARQQRASFQEFEREDRDADESAAWDELYAKDLGSDLLYGSSPDRMELWEDMYSMGSVPDAPTPRPPSTHEMEAWEDPYGNETAESASAREFLRSEAIELEDLFLQHLWLASCEQMSPDEVEAQMVLYKKNQEDIDNYAAYQGLLALEASELEELFLQHIQSSSYGESLDIEGIEALKDMEADAASIQNMLELEASESAWLYQSMIERSQDEEDEAAWRWHYRAWWAKDDATRALECGYAINDE